MPTRHIVCGAATWLITCLLVTPTYAQRPPNAPSPGPTMAQAMAALEAANDDAESRGVRLSCAVVDSRGDLVALTRMDGARFYSADVARGKAQVSAMFQRPSGEMGNLAQSPAFENFNQSAQGRLYPFQGALPIMKGDETVGAMGCSGAASQVDEDVVRGALTQF